MTPAVAQPQSPQPTSPPLTTPPISSSPKSRLLLHLAGGIVLLITIVIATLIIAKFFVTQKPQSTTAQEQTENSAADNNLLNWKNYENDKYGLSFLYPPQFSYEAAGKDYYQIQARLDEPRSGHANPTDYTLIFSDGILKFSLNIYSQYPGKGDYDVGGAMSGGVVLDENPIIDEFNGSCNEIDADKTISDHLVTIGEVKAIETLQVFDDKTDIRYCFITGTNYLVGLETYQLTDRQINSSKQLLQQILSTFKFITYPIYPNAVFIRNEDAPSCEDAPARGECGQTASIWQTSDSLDKVLNWYKSNHDGWKFESLNDQDSSNNPIFGYLKNETGLLYVELYKNGNIATIKIFNQS